MLDQEGKKHIHINHNVLIEIGAAIALYQKRVILLVEKGLPRRRIYKACMVVNMRATASITKRP